MCFFFFFFNLFMAVLDLRFCARAFSSCGERGPLFITVRGPLTVAASLVAEHRLQTRRLSSCGSWAQLLRSMWDPPRPGLEPLSPALAGRFSTTAPPGKLPRMFLFSLCSQLFSSSIQVLVFFCLILAGAMIKAHPPRDPSFIFTTKHLLQKGIFVEEIQWSLSSLGVCGRKLGDFWVLASFLAFLALSLSQFT